MKHPFLPMLAGGLFAVTLPFATLSAQTAAAPKDQTAKIQERLNKMKESLALTDDQVAKLKAVYDEQKAKLDPIFADTTTTLTKEQKAEKATPITDETRTKIDAVLTADQKAKLDQIRSDHKARKQDKKDQ